VDLEPAEPAQPAEPAKPAAPAEPVEPAGPTAPAEPAPLVETAVVVPPPHFENPEMRTPPDPRFWSHFSHILGLWAGTGSPPVATAS